MSIKPYIEFETSKTACDINLNKLKAPLPTLEVF
jgi:hypothetical protein